MVEMGEKNMVWEDIEEDESELLRDVDCDARRKYYGTVRGGMFWYLAALLAVSGASLVLAMFILEMRS